MYPQHHVCFFYWCPSHVSPIVYIYNIKNKQNDASRNLYNKMIGDIMGMSDLLWVIDNLIILWIIWISLSLFSIAMEATAKVWNWGIYDGLFVFLLNLVILPSDVKLPVGNNHMMKKTSEISGIYHDLPHGMWTTGMQGWVKRMPHQDHLQRTHTFFW